MTKLRNLAMLYLIETLRCDTWQEPCDATLDRNYGMLYLIHRACSLSCHHAYVYFQFIHAMLSLPVFMLKVTRTYSVFMTDPFCFASFSSVSPPPKVCRAGMQLSLDLTKLQGFFLYGLDFSWLWLALLLYWGMIYEYSFMLLYYCKIDFDVNALMTF